MLRIVSAAVAATLFGFTGLASAQTAGYPYSTDRSITAPSNRGYEQNYRYDQNYRGTPNSRWGAGPTGSSTASNTMHDRDYGAARNNNQFASEAEARSNCRGDTVVWEHQITRLPFRGVAFSRQHQARGLHVPRRCRS
jgi:hypothetical protein